MGLGAGDDFSKHVSHDDVIKWKHFPRSRKMRSVRRMHSPVNSPHKGQWRGALIFSFICVWINGWANNREAGDLRRHRPHYDVTAMCIDANKEAIIQTQVPCHACRGQRVEPSTRWNPGSAPQNKALTLKTFVHCWVLEVSPPPPQMQPVNSE